MKRLLFIGVIGLSSGLVVGCQCGGSAAPPSPTPSRVSLGLPPWGSDPAASGSARELPEGPAPSADDPDDFRRMIAQLDALHGPKQRPGPGDWLSQHDEPGQTFEDYRHERPNVPDHEAGTGKRRTLYIQQLGELSPTHAKIVELTARYMRQFFAVPVKLRPPLPLTLVPAHARRVQAGTTQLLSSYVLDEVLLPRLPEDATAYLSLTASDLWPGRGWNFVFGQASLTERVGVWSVHRYGNPDESEGAYRRALLRTLKVAVHETGHMFSMKHCTAHACVMGGSNNLEETDRAPLWLCPQCAAKLCWATHTDPVSRYRGLESFAREQGFDREATFFAMSIDALLAPTPAPGRPRPPVNSAK